MDDCVSQVDSLFESINEADFDFDVRFRNACSDDVHIDMRATLYTPSGVPVSRSASNKAGGRYEPGQTLWHCKGPSLGGKHCLLHHPRPTGGTYTVKYNWIACYNDQYYEVECNVDYPDE